MPSCPQCNGSSVDVDDARGTATCTTCGTVLEDNIIMSEVTFADERTVVERFVDAEGRGSYSMAPPGFHGFGRDSRAITVANGRRSIQQMASKMQLNTHNVDTAHGYFKMAVEHRFIQGRKTEHVVAACLYVVCRLEQTSHMLLDFADLLQVNVYALATCFIKLCRRLHLNMPIIDPVLFIPRFAHQLDFGDQAHEVGKTALRLVSRMKRDWIHVGRRPAGVCGAGLLIAGRLHGFSRTQKEVINAVRVCDSTLRKRLEEFEDTPSSALTVAQFQSIELEGEADPPSFKRHQEERQQKAIDANVVQEMESLSESAPFRALEGGEKDAEPGAAQPVAAASADVDSAAAAAGAIVPVAQPGHEEAWTMPTNAETLSDVEDGEVEEFFLSKKEVEVKTKVWVDANKEYLDKQAAKAKQAEYDKLHGITKQTKKRKRRQQRPTEPAADAEAAVQQMLSQKKVSKKINYALLERLLPGEGDAGAAQPAETTVKVVSESGEAVMPPPAPAAASATASVAGVAGEIPLQHAEPSKRSRMDVSGVAAPMTKLPSVLAPMTKAEVKLPSDATAAVGGMVLSHVQEEELSELSDELTEEEEEDGKTTAAAAEEEEEDQLLSEEEYY